MALFVILALLLISLAAACIVLPGYGLRAQPGQAVAQGAGRLWPWGLAVLVLVLSSSLYLYLGAPVALQQHQALQALDDKKDADSFVAALEDMVQRWPDNAKTRFMLASVYRKMGRYPEAAAAFAQVVEQSGGKDAEPIAQLAQARYMAQGNKVDVIMAELVERALALDPDNTLALGLSGIAAFEQQRYTKALQAWQRLQELTADPAEAQMLASGIERAREAIAAQGPEAESTAAPTAGLRVHVALAEGARPLPSTARVFVFARVPERPAPVAVVSLLPGDLPRDLTLDDSNAMIPGVHLSDYPQVNLVARLSLSGNALDADDESQVKSIRPGDSDRISLILQGKPS